MLTFILFLALFGAGYLLFREYTKSKEALTRVSVLDKELEKYSPIKDLNEQISKLKNSFDRLKTETDEVKSKLDVYESSLDLHELGYYQPKFNFGDMLQYAEALDLTREAQKELIRQKLVIEGFSGSNSSKKNKDVVKLAISAFNGEVSGIIETVKYDNYEKCKNQVETSYTKINSLIEDTGLKISSKYLDLKIKELALVYDFKEQERKSKDEQAELKAAMREEEAARVEAEKAREKAIEEQKRYEAALEQARKEMATKSDEEKLKYEAKILEYQDKLAAATAERERATSMAQITKKGHVYIISNIGSFGENVLKIGMTRRKDPHDRIKELGDASVPFEFDVHAMIEAEDAPKLENTLHNYFVERRKNRVNQRKEFFQISIDEVEQACSQLGLNFKLTKVAEAREYRESIAHHDKSKAA